MKEEIVKILMLERKDFQERKRYVYELIIFSGAIGGGLLVYFVTKYCSYLVFQVLAFITVIMLAFSAAFHVQRRHIASMSSNNSNKPEKNKGDV
jgi:hypothetical protein